MIYLDEINESDLRLIYNWRKKNPIIKYLKIRTEFSKKEQEKWINLIKENEQCKYWMVRSGNIKIGIVDIYKIDYLNSSCTIEFCIADENFRKREISPEVLNKVHKLIFEELKINNIYCNILRGDKRSEDVFSKFGYKLVGKFEYNNMVDKENREILYFKITKDKWINKKS